MKLGASFSHRFVKELGLEPKLALERLFELELDVVRLGVYWDEVEFERGSYNWEEIESLLKLCEDRQQDVCLSVGMKAPRWPEFYIPQWVGELGEEERESAVLQMVKKTVERMKKFDCIVGWQVENEPLDPSGPDGKRVDEKLLEREVEVVKVGDDRPVMVNLWGNDMSSRGVWRKAAEIADIVGVDVYFWQFVTKKMGRAFYRGPRDRRSKLTSLVEEIGKPVWISELQAEPWEESMEEYLSESPKSMSPVILKQNWEQVRYWSVAAVVFWGYEYWYWRYTKGDNRYFEVVGEILKENRA